MDATKLQQGFNQEIRFVKHMDYQMFNNNNNDPTPNSRVLLEKKTRPKEELNCPRCNSTKTKFCYYNNYSLTQPRYFCKACRRYWTEGGSLRNVPVGGGSRKNKKSSIVTSSSSANKSASTVMTSSKILPDLNPPFVFSNHQDPKLQSDPDLNLSFSSMQEGGQCQFGNFSQYLQMPTINETDQPNPCSSLELLRTGVASRRLNGNFMPAPVQDSNTTYNNSLGFALQQEYYKPILGFSTDGVGEVRDNVINGSRVLFPFGEMKELIPSTATSEVEDHQQNIKRQSNSSGNELWIGMLSGGQSW